MEPDTESESEQAGLLAGSAIGIEVLDREVTTVESRLIIVAFVFLCLGSIGFGLFAGEVSKYQKLEHGERITMTVTAPSGKPTSPPTPPDKLCSSGPCVEASAELMKTINWDADPCRDFDRFAMRRTQTPVTDAIKVDINHFIKNLLFEQLHPTTRTLEKFYSTCTHFTDLYKEALPLLKNISIVWNGTDPLDWSRTTRITSALAYTHARALPAFFTNSLTNEKTRITPAPLNVTGIEKAFRDIYSRSEITRRLEGVKELKAQLDAIMGHQSPSVVVSLDELQDLVCDDKLAPCLLRWKEYYSSLSSIRPMSKVIVDGIEYFRRLPSVVAAQSDETIESYFHWITISALSDQVVDCSRDLRWFFGPLLARHYFSALSDGRNDLQVKAETAHFVLSSVLNSTSEHPIEIVFPSIEDDQVEELAAVEKGDHVGNLLRLAQIKTRKMFDEHQMSWDMLEPALQVDGRHVYCPATVLQSPFVYSLPDVPLSLTFGSLGVWSIEEIVTQTHTLPLEKSMTYSITTSNQSISQAFSSWKRSRRGTKTTLVGLKSLTEDQLFFVAFARLGFSSQTSRIDRLPEFIEAFRCRDRYL